MEIDTNGNHHRWQWWHFALLAVTGLLIFAPCDITIARFWYRYSPSQPLFKAIEIAANVIGHGVGALALVLVAVIFAGRSWTRLPRLISASLGAGLLADIFKLCICRTRPHSLDLSAATLASTFHGLFPMFSPGSAGQSFPSGHAATAAGLAVAMSMMFPRRRWLFALLAAGVAVSRVIVHAHFPTDVVAGLALGGAWSWACHRGFVAPVFAWLERKLENRFPQLATGLNAAPDAQSA